MDITMSSDAQPPHRVVPSKRRRDKPILSCTLCRRRKLKCDRQQPCNSCVHRGLSLSCAYTPLQATQGPKAPESVHNRIDQLEKLVTSLMDEKTRIQEGSSVGSRPPSRHNLSADKADGDVPGTPDRVKLNSDATSYSNSGHWTSILDGITELRDELDRIAATDEPSDPKEAQAPGPDLLFGRQLHASKHEILAAIPPRQEADQLVNTFFACMDMAPMTLHKKTFLRKYEELWERPFETPIMWIGLLFSILATASRFQVVLNNPQHSGNLPEVSPNPLSYARTDLYREKSAQCLVLANYSKCPPYTVEALLQYFLTEYFRSPDTQFGIWMVVGIIVRAALRMGYHRDPSRFPNISPFDGEMRRRTWVMIVQLDLMFSSQLGLPGMIEPSLYDVAEPRNLVDDDLSEDMTELPPSRPDTEPTVMMYTLVRNRVLQVFKRIADLANSTTSPAYRDVLSLDKELRAVYDNFPSSMKAIRVKDFQYADSPTARRRLFLGLSFLKAMLMLHRPFLLLGRADTRYEYSRSVCLNTALEILDYQKKLNAEARPGGRLWTLNWRIWAALWRTSSVVNHDFLLATTVLTLDLDRDTGSFPTPQDVMAPQADSTTPLPTRPEIIDALTSAYTIWEEQSETSREAKKVAAAVRLVLRKANAIFDDDASRYDPETPMSQFDFATFAEQGSQSLAFPDAGSLFYNFDSSLSAPSFLADELFGDIPYTNWGGPESDMTAPFMGDIPGNSYLP